MVLCKNCKHKHTQECNERFDTLHTLPTMNGERVVGCVNGEYDNDISTPRSRRVPERILKRRA